MNLTDTARPHLQDLERWLAGLGELTLDDPANSAVACVDVIEGFTRIGPLASPRVDAVVPNVHQLLRAGLDAGVPPGQIALIVDAHPEGAEEFRAFVPHAVRGTAQARLVPELRDLPEVAALTHCPKNAVASHHSPEFTAWLNGLRVGTVVVVGDVTDLCVYALAHHLITHSHAHGLGRRVVIPADCVQTWDAPDHPGDLYHALFLYQLQRSGCEVVGSLRWG